VATTSPDSMAEQLNLYLSRKAASTWPDSVVVETESCGFVLRRRGRPEMVLADNFGQAKQALALLRRAEAPEPEQS